MRAVMMPGNPYQCVGVDIIFFLDLYFLFWSMMASSLSHPMLPQELVVTV